MGRCLRILPVPALIALTLAACAPARAPAPGGRASAPAPTLPPAPKASPLMEIPAPPARPNGEIARDFMDLMFRTEKGARILLLSRFEGPLGVALGPGGPPSASGDLDRLLARLRREAGLDIRRARAIPPAASGPAPASISIEFIPAARFRNRAPNAACFVAPGVSSWREYRRKRSGWAGMVRRSRMAIFIPTGQSGQETRDCLHEEIAQALGPPNDLYRLADSTFNDDNLQTTLTGFDMLILRALYAPELHSGMPAQAVEARLPALLARLNPGGEGSGMALLPPPTPRAWHQAIERAIGAGGRAAPKARRIEAARQAVAIARRAGLHDGRLALSLLALGRVSLRSDPARAEAALEEALALYGSTPANSAPAAHALWQLAVLALSRGQWQRAESLAARAEQGARQSANAALLSDLLLIRAEALARTGRGETARRLRLDSARLARYGFASAREIRRRAREIGAIASEGSHREGT